MTTKQGNPRERLELMNRIKKEQEKKRLSYELPHLFGYPPYKWTLQYWASTNRMKFLTAGNQLSKSSTQVRHAIDLATEPSKWPKYFPKWAKDSGTPPVFWYIYPNKSKIMEEWDKWEREFLPRGSMKDDKQYGWWLERDKDGIPQTLRFRSGSVIWLKTWYQDHQAGTLAGLFIDEELPVDLWAELAMRVTRYDGFISMVFTATLNQPFFFDIIERRGEADERYPKADKWQISMEYDCRYYADGSESPWTPEEVAKQKAKCGTDDEINRRVHGRFVSNKGRKFPSFSRNANIKARRPLDLTWEFYAGVDIGSGGEEGHPAAIAIVAVRPDYKYARLVRLWCGNQQETTNSTQILNQFLAMTRDLPITKAYYDWSSAEFKLRAQEAGVPFDKAEKSQDFGTDLLNVLFKNQLLEIDEGPEVLELAQELENLRRDTLKKNAKDDRIDAVRYAVSKVPFDLGDITSEVVMYEHEVLKKELTQDDRRAGKKHQWEEEHDKRAEWGFDEECDFYNDYLE